MTKADLIAQAKKELRMYLDETIEDMGSYIEAEENLSYEDALFEELLKRGNQFIESQLFQAIDVALQETKVEKKHIAKGESSNLDVIIGVAGRSGYNLAVAEQESKRKAFLGEPSK
jgi:hypothetical protein